VPWKKGKLVGAKPPLRPSHIWSIETKLQIEGKKRVFNLAIDSKLRGCDGDPIPLRADTVGGATCVADCRPSMAAIGSDRVKTARRLDNLHELARVAHSLMPGS